MSYLYNAFDLLMTGCSDVVRITSRIGSRNEKDRNILRIKMR